MEAAVPEVRVARSRLRVPRLTLPQTWAGVAILLPSLLVTGFPLSTIDLAYHVRAGQGMLRTHDLLQTDTFSFTASGTPWLNQQWGAQIILAVFFGVGAWAGLALVRTILVGLTLFFVYKASLAAGADRTRAAWLTLGAFAVSLSGAMLRPQLFGIALFALTVWLVADRERRPGGLWAVPAIVVIWANLHGSFFLAPVLLALAWLEDRRRRSSLAGRTGMAAIAAVAAATINPVGLRIWTYVLDISGSSQITQTIDEWQPPTIRTAGGIVFFASVVLVAAVLLRRDRPTSWPVLLSLGLFFGISLMAHRGITWWGLAIPPIMAGLLGPRPPRPLDHRAAVLNTAILGVVAVAGAALLLPWTRGTRPDQPSPRLVVDAPVGITAAVDRRLEPGEPFFNPQRWGSWFELALPENPIFVDSRVEVFPESVWRESGVVSQGQEGWDRVLDRWHIDLVVAEYKQQADLIPRIRDHPEWRLAYEDADGVVFVRSGSHGDGR